MPSRGGGSDTSRWVGPVVQSGFPSKPDVTRGRGPPQLQQGRTTRINGGTLAVRFRGCR